MKKSEFILRAASNAPAVPSHYSPDYPVFINPEKVDGETEIAYRLRRSKVWAAYNNEKQAERAMSWPLYYARELAAKIESDDLNAFEE